MAPIIFPRSSAPGRDLIEGAGRLTNAYSERLQEGAPGSYVIRRAPGIVSFCATSETGFRGLWFDDGANLFAVWDGGLYYIDSTGAETLVATIPTARLTYLTTLADTSNTTAYTFSATALGTAHTNRRIVVGISFQNADDSPPASVTIGGVAATLLKNQNSQLALYIAVVPTGATGDIVVTYATAALNCGVVVYRLDGLSSSTPYATAGANATGTTTSALIAVPENGLVTGAFLSTSLADAANFTATASPDTATRTFPSYSELESGLTLRSWRVSATDATTITATATPSAATVAIIAASFEAAPPDDVITWAKNNKSPTPDYVLCTAVTGAYRFTTTGITALNVNSETPNSVCFGEGYLFFTTPDGLCYASALNTYTVNSLDVTRVEQRADGLVRGIFFNGELYLFCKTHCEVYASGGNPNLSGFPLNYTTSVWRGLIAPLAICGMEAGFHPGLVWVGDDRSVHQLQGYTPVEISSPDVNRALVACTDVTGIRCFVFHEENGHPMVAVDINEQSTWVYDLSEQTWHERKTTGYDYWRLTGNSTRAFNKWIAGDHLSGNLYEITTDALDDAGTAIRWEVESISMAGFPAEFVNSRAQFNFVTGVGTTSEPDPVVYIQWSKDGGHTWSTPVARKLGELGRYRSKLWVNRLGRTKGKGFRFRLYCDDAVEVGLLGGDMTAVK